MYLSAVVCGTPEAMHADVTEMETFLRLASTRSSNMSHAGSEKTLSRLENLRLRSRRAAMSQAKVSVCDDVKSEGAPTGPRVGTIRNDASR